MPSKQFIPCVTKSLTKPQIAVALSRSAFVPGKLTMDTDRWWGKEGRKFTVAFASSATQATRNKILKFANLWSKYGNVEFVASKIDPDIRISFDNSGYWSYLGDDILGIPKNEATMNLQGFTASTSDAEYHRVVCHEFGHTLGFPHEHMRAEIVALLDERKTIAYFKRTQGWTERDVRQQVLTPLNVASIRGTPNADDMSIMCYQLPGSITKNGKPIRGGDVINQLDGEFFATIYPKPIVVPPVEPPVEPGVMLPATFTGSCTINGVVYNASYSHQ